MSDLIRAPRPVGLGADLPRLLAALAIGALFAAAYWVLLPWAVDTWLLERELGL